MADHKEEIDQLKQRRQQEIESSRLKFQVIAVISAAVFIVVLLLLPSVFRV